MGQSQLLAARLAALTVVAVQLLAQGPLYRERWADLHLLLLRERVLVECGGRDDETVKKVASLLVEGNDSIPFRPASKALAHLRGVACDEAFLVRSTIGAFVLPEVVDPEGQQPACHSLNVTVLLPYLLPMPGGARFNVQVFDGAGERCFDEDFGAGASIEDLCLGQVRATVPCGEFADGTYRVRLTTIFDGKGPREHDFVVEHRFFVQRGYQRRAESVQQRFPAVAAALAPLPYALLRGLVQEMNRAYAGEAFDGSSDAVADLQRAEAAVSNVAADKFVIAGFTDLLPAALPAGRGEVLPAVLRWPDGDQQPKDRRPLVVVLSAMPAFDPDGRRPSWPEVRSGRWAHRRVGDFGLGTQFPFAWLQSPGGTVEYSKSLPIAIAALHELLPTDGTTILVAELEAAVAICYAPDVLKLARGLVLVGAGAMTQKQLEAMADVPMLGIPLTGHASAGGLAFTAEVAEQIRRAGGKSGYQLATPRPRPWIGGAQCARGEIAQFDRADTAAQ